MKNLILSLFFGFLTFNYSFTQTWQQLGNSFPVAGVNPIIKNLSNGTPVVVFANNSTNLSIAVFDTPNQSWDIQTFGSISNVQNLSVDVVDDKVFIGCKSSSINYGVYYYNVSNSTFNTVTTSTPFYYNNNVALSVGSFSPLRIAIAYETVNGYLACAEWNGTVFQHIGGNALDISGGYVVYDELKISTDENFIYVVSNFDEDMDFPLRVFSKQFGSAANFTQPTGSPIEGFGGVLFDVSNSKIDQGFQPTYNFIEGNVNNFNLIQTRRHQATNALTANLPNHDAFYDVLELAAVSDEEVNYVFFRDENLLVSPNYVLKSESSSGGFFSQVGGNIQTGTITGMGMGMNYITKKPYVGYFQGGSYTVKTFNSAPNFEDAGLPTDLCEGSFSEIILDYLLFLDDDGDELFVSNILSSNPSVIDASNILVNNISYNPNSGANEFEVELDVAGVSGTSTITIEVTDGIETASYQFSVTVHPTYNETDEVSICNGSSYQFGTQSITEAGIYTESFTSVTGCDSIVELTVSVLTPDFELPFNETCSNVGPITLMSHVSPVGGNFSGAGVLNNKFHPSQVAANNTYTITYSRYYSLLGCTATATQEITVNPAPMISVSTTSATCGDNDGEATANFTTPGSGGLHDIYWSNGTTELDVTSSTITDLEPGLYFVNATNEFGCSASAPATVSSTSIQINGTASHVSCFGGNDGGIDVTISSTAGVASINWSNGNTTEDLTNITAGAYEITVVDNDGCQASATFTVNSPSEITWTTSINPSTCGNADGSVTVIPQGGTAPYNYQWFDGQGNALGSTTDTQSGLVASNYLCTISDDNGCSKVVSVVISDVGSPIIELNTVTTASCDNDGAIDIDIVASAPIQSITWSNGETTEDISNLAPGNYSVHVMDGNGCVGMLSVEVEPTLPTIQPICLVTVDTLTVTNKIVWEREQITGIDTYNIYRETSQANVYQLVHTQSYADESEWTDTVASPMIRSWRYMISATDDCGIESELSPVHKTIHLTINAGVAADVNLAWDSYEGFSYSEFNIWRYTDATGWIPLTSLPSTLFTYTDIGVLGIPGLDYFIEVEPAELCVSEKAQDYNSSRSNKARGEFNPDGVGNISHFEIEAMAVYPNPASDEITINISTNAKQALNAVLIDATGKQIKSLSIENGLNTFSINQLEKGMYFIQISENGANKTVKFVKN